MIRLLEPQDFALWRALRLEALQDSPQAFGDAYEEKLTASDEDWMLDLQNSHLFAYFNEEQPVGVVGYQGYKQAKRRHRGIVSTGFVTKDFRGKGIMDWLLGALAYHARDHGVEQLHAEVSAACAHALRCYERNGFAAYATEPRAFKTDGEYIDGYHMVKCL